MKAKVVVVAVANDPYTESVDELKQRIKEFGLPDEGVEILDVFVEKVDE